MKWIVSADSLVDDGMGRTVVEAEDAAAAENIGYQWALKDRTLDAGTVEVEPLEEDKQAICNKLSDLLQMTRGLFDVEELTYEKTASGEEVVTALFRSGRTKIANVTGDSGVAMILDIVRQIR